MEVEREKENDETKHGETRTMRRTEGGSDKVERASKTKREEKEEN
jgi:hypothetical protein